MTNLIFEVSFSNLLSSSKKIKIKKDEKDDFDELYTKLAEKIQNSFVKPKLLKKDRIPDISLKYKSLEHLYTDNETELESGDDLEILIDDIGGNKRIIVYVEEDEDIWNEKFLRELSREGSLSASIRSSNNRDLMESYLSHQLQTTTTRSRQSSEQNHAGPSLDLNTQKQSPVLPKHKPSNVISVVPMEKEISKSLDITNPVFGDLSNPLSASIRSPNNRDIMYTLPETKSDSYIQISSVSCQDITMDIDDSDKDCYKDPDNSVSLSGSDSILVLKSGHAKDSDYDIIDRPESVNPDEVLPDSYLTSDTHIKQGSTDAIQKNTICKESTSINDEGNVQLNSDTNCLVTSVVQSSTVKDDTIVRKNDDVKEEPIIEETQSAVETKIKKYSEILTNNLNDKGSNKSSHTVEGKEVGTSNRESTLNHGEPQRTYQTQSLLGTSAKNPENRSIAQNVKKVISDGLHGAGKILGLTEETCKVNIVLCVPKDVHSILCVGWAVVFPRSTYSSRWNEKECSLSYNTDCWSIYTVDIEVPLHSTLVYKFYKYRVMGYGNPVKQWEYLSYEYSEQVGSGFRNRVLRDISYGTTVYVACEFSYNMVSVDQYLNLITTIMDQSTTESDFCLSMDSFVQRTLNDTRNGCKNLMKQEFSDNFLKYVESETHAKPLMRKLQLLWVLPNFPKKKGFSLPAKCISKSMEILFSLVDEPEIEKLGKKVLERCLGFFIELIKKHVEKAASLLIVCAILEDFLPNTNDEINLHMMADLYNTARNLTLDAKFIEKFSRYFKEHPKVRKFCAPFCNPTGLSKLKQHLSLSEVLNCISVNWELEKMFSTENDKAVIEILDYIQNQIYNEDVTTILSNILKRIGFSLNNSKYDDFEAGPYRKPHVSGAYAYSSISDSYRNQRSPHSTTYGKKKDAQNKLLVNAFYKICISYVLSTIIHVKEIDIGEFQSMYPSQSFISTIQLSWWADLYVAAISTPPKDKTDESQHNKELVLKNILLLFEQYMISLSDEHKHELISKDDFLNEEKMPKELCSIIINNIQLYIIQALKTKTFYSLKGLKESITSSLKIVLEDIMKRKFPNGVNYNCLMVGEGDEHYFPWEGVFELKGFQDNARVKDAKGTLCDTLNSFNSRDVTLNMVKMLSAGFTFNQRIKFLMGKILKKDQYSELVTLDEVTKEYEKFSVTLTNCHLLIDKFGQLKGVDVTHKKIEEKPFLNMKIRDIWKTDTEFGFMVIPNGPFRGLVAQQLSDIQLVKMIQKCKIFEREMRESLSSIKEDDFDTENLLFEIVAKVYEPTLHLMKEMVMSVKQETVIQENAKRVFSVDGLTYNTFNDVKNDLNILCNCFDISISDDTYKKLEIILSDMNSCFDCIDSLRHTLNLQKHWVEVEKLRKKVCKANNNEPLGAIPTNIDLTFLFKVRDTRPLVTGLAESEELINWIKEVAKDEKDMNTFMDLSNTLEDPTTADRLAGLHKIIQAIRPLLYELQDNGSFVDFQRAFNKMFDVVNEDKQITKGLKDVRDNMEWFKNMQQLQTDTTKSSLSQVEMIREQGHFFVGNRRKRTEFNDFFEEEKVEDLLKVVIIDTDKEIEREMKYKVLKELNDKLVLISGQQHYQDKVDVFTQVFDRLRTMCGVYKELNECGHKDYQQWRVRFKFNHPEHALQDVMRMLDNMKEQLIEQKEYIEKRIREDILLANFTRLQLLFLRYNLPQCCDTVNSDIMMLLQSINPQITKDMVKGEMRKLFGNDQQEMLPLEELGKLLKTFHAGSQQECQAHHLTNYLRVASATLLKVTHSDIFRTVLSMFMTAGKVPTAEEVLCCSAHTNEEQISIFLRRTIIGNDFRKINCLVNPENMSYTLNKFFIEEYDRLRKTNINIQPEFFLVIITPDNVASEISSHFQSSSRTFPLQQNDRIKEFITKKILVDEKITCDADSLSGRLVQSEASGNGKTRFANLCLDDNDREYKFRCIPMHKRYCDRNVIVKQFLKRSPEEQSNKKTMYLVDISPAVFSGVDIFIFELLILRKITDSAGRVFRPFSGDYMLIEGLFALPSFVQRFPIDFTSFLPKFECLGPFQSLAKYRSKEPLRQDMVLLEEHQFKSVKWQRIYQYLCYYSQNEGSMTNFKFNPNQKLLGRDHEQRCIETFLRHIDIENPSWRELDNFAGFLDTQLNCYESSSFTSEWAQEDLGPDFNSFVVKFMITMSKEFATRSLTISEGNNVMENHRLEKLWDKTFHPYLFFNRDGHSVTFIGFNIETPGRLVDPITGEVKDPHFMKQELLGRLKAQQVVLKMNYHKITVEMLMEKLRTVMQLNDQIIPAEDYQLTLDNTVKILAIHMRMRSNIPVVIMGETGCGKTRLISFMCDIVKQSVLTKHNVDPETVQNLITLRVHGGITTQKIMDIIDLAEDEARINTGIDPSFETIVFFDEANATSEIDLIKEIMCNHTINGRRINSSIRFIAAVNPYRKHSPEMIDLLKKAGLGYRTKDEHVIDRIGDIPLREVVYRVQPLPPSLRPLIWDFGSMDTVTEKGYIKLIVNSKLVDEPITQNFKAALVDVISGCQDLLRRRTDQCSFVSLRDVNRFMEVFKWFMKMIPDLTDLIRESPQYLNLRYDEEETLPMVVLATINAIGVCYYVRMSRRKEYIQDVAQYFREPYPVLTGKQLKYEIERTQKVFLFEMLHRSGVTFQEDIAENEALRENIFMMVVCIELNIPLFIVGHPGSSKSLAKLIVKECMSGLTSTSTLFAKLCQIYMTSFQCSPQSEAEGIERVFEAAEKFISDDTGNKQRRVMPVVVLDEIGLAEDSPKMPLKALHSLLENNGFSDKSKIGFIGISNWALDPAKMNRGLYVTRQIPDVEELKLTAIQICKKDMQDRLRDHLNKISEVYMEIYQEFSQNNTKSYIGLRDFYCLIKHLCRKAEDKKAKLSDIDVMNGVYRNFGGICPDANSTVLEKFNGHFKIEAACKPNALNMIRENLRASSLKSGSRYLLIVTPTLETTIDTIDNELRALRPDETPPQIKFNSDFPDDHDYTKVCKAINDVKNSIERGDDLLLIDMEMLYESLYDVLNQYYKEYQNNKYVEIGLESHRVNCRVHEGCKIILLARPEQAEKFPIPLLNRMEKHYFTLEESMSNTELNIVRLLKEWLNDLTNIGPEYNFDINQTFIGYHQDTVASIVKTEWKKIQQRLAERRIYASLINNDLHRYTDMLLDICKRRLLKTVSYDGLVRFSLSTYDRYTDVWNMYYETGADMDSIRDLRSFFHSRQTGSHTVITTYSDLPAQRNIPIPKGQKMIAHNVQEFGSQSSFENALIPYFRDPDIRWLVILVPASSHNLLSYMRFQIQSERSMLNNHDKNIVIITQINRNTEERPAMFHSEVWQNFHIEDLSPDKDIENLSRLGHIWNLSLPQLFDEGVLDPCKVIKQYKQQIICGISNPFPHSDISHVVQECLAASNIIDRIKVAMSKHMGDNSDLNWIQQAAVDRTCLSEASSFHRVLMLKIANSITPAASSTFADIDRDGNMALRCDSQLTLLWEDLLCVVNWSNISYKDTSRLHNIQHSFLCKSHTQTTQFPFSWIIKEQIDVLRDPIMKLSSEDDDKLDSYLLELKNMSLYEILSQVEDIDLTAQLNTRYLADYVNMTYASHSATEMLIARRIFEVNLPEDILTRPVIEAAVEAHLLFYCQLDEELRALEKLFIVYRQVFCQQDVSFFEECTRSDQPLFSLCTILLKRLEERIDFISRAKSFTIPIKHALAILKLHYPDLYPDLSRHWDRVRLKCMYQEFLEQCDVIPDDLKEISYVQIQETLKEKHIEDSLGAVIDIVQQMIQDTVEKLNLQQQLTIDTLWECQVKGSECCYVYNHIITPCYHVLCEDCYHKLPPQPATNNKVCPSCRENIPRVYKSPPDNVRVLIELVSTTQTKAVKFISLAIVNFMSDKALDEESLHRLSLLGKGRIAENMILRAVHPDHIESLQTLIFNVFLNKNKSLKPERHIPYIAEACLNADGDINIPILSKFMTIQQYTIGDDNHAMLGIVLEEYKKLCYQYNNDMEQEERKDYLYNSICVLADLRLILCGLVRDVLAWLDNEETLSERLKYVRAQFQDLSPQQTYSLKLFFLKQIVKKRGTDILSKIMEDREVSWVSPVTEIAAARPDYFAMLGEQYTTVRNALVVGNNIDEIDEALEAATSLDNVLATYYVQQDNAINIPTINVIRERLQNEERHSLECFNSLCGTQTNQTQLLGLNIAILDRFKEPLALLFCLIKCQCRHPFIRLIENLVLHPEQADNRFLPGMRDNVLSEFVGNLREAGRTLKWFRCSNGHAYAINNCGQPMERGTCVCGAVIGGEQHRFAEGNVAELTNNNNLGFNEKGYNLVPPTIRPLMDTERKLQPLTLNLVRWYIHAAFLLSPSINQHKQRLFNYHDNIHTYLIENMQRDFRGIRDQLQVGPDESMIFLMKSLVLFIESTENVSITCASKDDRAQLEDSIIRCMGPLLQNTETVIREANNMLVNDLNVAQDQFMKQIYEIEDPEDTLGVPHCNIELWRNAKTVDMDMFCSSFTNTLNLDQQNRYPATKTFIEIKQQIDLLKLLPLIVEFSKTLVSRFSYKCTRQEAAEIPIGDIIENDPILTAGFEAWKTAWRDLGVQGTRFAVPQNYVDIEEISKNHPLALFLPYTNGEGIACLHIIDALLTMHNKLAKCKRDGATPILVYDRFIPIVYDPDACLMFMLYGHSTKLVGKHRDVKFSYDVFEQYLVDEMLGGIQVIEDGLSQFEHDSIKMTYREDVNWLTMCKQLHEKEPQEMIPEDISLVFNDIQAASEAMKAFSIAIGFIRAGLGLGSAAHEELLTFMERIKCTSPGNKTIPRTLQKKHVLAAWYTAYYYKSIKSKQNPFSELDVATNPSNDVESWFTDTNQRILEHALVELHRFIVDWTVVKRSEELKGWELPECYEFWSEDAILTPNPDNQIPQFPDTLLYEDSVAFWLLIKQKFLKIK